MADIRHNWSLQEVDTLFNLPLTDLMFRAQNMHRRYFPTDQIQMSTLLSIKTGTCPEDCAYCPQSGHYNTGLKKDPLISIEEVIENAKIAKQNGATRFLYGGCLETSA